MFQSQITKLTFNKKLISSLVEGLSRHKNKNNLNEVCL